MSIGTIELEMLPVGSQIHTRPSQDMDVTVEAIGNSRYVMNVRLNTDRQRETATIGLRWTGRHPFLEHVDVEFIDEWEGTYLVYNNLDLILRTVFRDDCMAFR